MAIRRARLFAEAVTVACGYCGEPQPNREGSEMWIAEDFQHKSGRHQCIACDEWILIESDSRAAFDNTIPAKGLRARQAHRQEAARAAD